MKHLLWPIPVLILFLSVLICITATQTAAQTLPLKPFVLRGTINADRGAVSLYLLTEDSSFYPKGMREISSEVKNGTFVFEGEIPYPQGVKLSYQGSYNSGMFIIDPGVQQIIVDIHSRKETPKLDNRSMEEYSNVFVPAFAGLGRETKRRTDSLSTLYGAGIPQLEKDKIEAMIRADYTEQDRTLLQFVRANPNSYYALWRFVYLLNFGYEEIFDAILSSFSDELRKTTTGEALTRKLKEAGILAINKPFPQLRVVDRFNRPPEVGTFSKARYTLVDFWYSNCSPCVAQFPELSAIYSEYRKHGFQIIGISTDREKYRDNWLSAVKEHGLPWLQYWDANGVESRKISVLAFPTNFLLDGEGKVLQKNIKPAELRQFLSDKLPGDNIAD